MVESMQQAKATVMHPHHDIDPNNMLACCMCQDVGFVWSRQSALHCLWYLALSYFHINTFLWVLSRQN